MRLRLSDAARALGIDWNAEDYPIASVCTDSRATGRGDLFVALRGARFDAHDFVIEVLQKGALAALVEQGFAEQHPDLPLLAVADTRAGFAALAAHWRRGFNIPLIGVVGSNGKTSVKEMCASILQAELGEAAVLATSGNLNNDIGVPMMALRLKAGHQAAVLEMGMNHPGETRTLAGIAQATIGLINNAQREHQEFMHSVQAVAEEHALLIDALDASGIVVFNADDDYAALWRARAGNRQMLDFGLVHGEVRGRLAAGRLNIDTPWGRLQTTLRVPGRHNALNACAAAAACLVAGVSIPAVASGLAAFGGVKGRLQSRPGRKNTRVIDDSYNANPDSMRAAIDVLASFPGRRIFVMGDMAEVGDNSAQMHDEIGGYAKSHGIDRLLALGDAARAAVRNFGSGATHHGSLESLQKALESELGAEVTVLIKGSRFMRMERVAEAIVEPAP